MKLKCMLYGSFADKIKTLTDYNMLYHSSLFTGSRYCKNTPHKISITALSQKFITSLNRDYRIMHIDFISALQACDPAEAATDIPPTVMNTLFEQNT